MISVVIPVLNGEKSIEGVVQSLIKMGKTEGLALEIILVDDASGDGSAMVIDRLASEYPQVQALKNNERMGQQETLLFGLSKASGDVLVTMDDDAQHDPGQIPKMVQEVEKGYDLVYGIVETSKTDSFRMLGSRMRDSLFLHLYPFLGENRVGSFRAFTRELHREAVKRKRRFSYISCMHLGFEPRLTNIQVEYRKSKREQSNYKLFSLIRLLLKIYWYYGPGANFNHRRDNTCE